MFSARLICHRSWASRLSFNVSPTPSGENCFSPKSKAIGLFPLSRTAFAQAARSLQTCCGSNKRGNLNCFSSTPRLDDDATLARRANLFFRSRASRQFSYGRKRLRLKSSSFKRWQKSLLPALANIIRLRNNVRNSRLTITSSLVANNWLNDLTIHYKISNP